MVFVLGVFLMRAAGCVVNDYADRAVDGYVKRTAEAADAELTERKREKRPRCCSWCWC